MISADKNLNIIYKVTRFSLKIPGRKAIIIQGDKIDEKAFNDINKYSTKGDEIAIFDICGKPNISVGCFLVGPMVIRIL